jgi:hypothetical protein
MANIGLTGWIVVAVLAAALPVVVALTPPSPARHPEMAAAATAVLEALDVEAAGRARFAFADEERRDWHYVPRHRAGIAVGSLTPAQRTAVDRLLEATLSPQGQTKVHGIIELEGILGRLEGNPAFRDPGLYHLAIFGDPDLSNPWGWRLEGHHLSLNVTSAPDLGVAPTPLFLGANPARVPDGDRAGWRVLAAEEDLARELVGDLDRAQLGRAILSERAPRDIITGAQRTAQLPEVQGLAAADMTGPQRQRLVRLIETYVRNLQGEHAERQLDRIFAGGIEGIHFAWAGGRGPGQPHYYRIHGPSLWIEYDNTQNDANHIHSVWRDPEGDFGDDLLRRHYEESDHHHDR